jgi:hypothetical protein
MNRFGHVMGAAGDGSRASSINASAEDKACASR